MRKILRTRAFEFRDWSDEEWARQTGLSIEMIHSLRLKRRGLGATGITAFQCALPELRFESLFYVEGDALMPTHRSRKVS